MNLYLRLLLVVLRALRGPRLRPDDTGVLKLRVWPNDLDIFFHANNGRIQSLLDLGRVHLAVRGGYLATLLSRRWYGVVAGIAVDYRRPLRLFSALEVRTKIVHWDEGAFYFQQWVVQGGEIAAHAICRAVFLGPSGKVSPAAMLAARGLPVDAPPRPTILDRLAHATGTSTSVSFSSSGVASLVR